LFACAQIAPALARRRHGSKKTREGKEIGMFNITRITQGKTRLFSPENVYGEKGKGAMADITYAPQPEVARIGQHWMGINPSARELGRTWKVRPFVHLPKQSVTTIMDTEGPGRITHMWLTVANRWFREIVVRIYWDEEETPSVECPLGDLFCSGFSENVTVHALPINANPRGGLNSFFPMPFRRHCRITLENLAPQMCKYFYYAITMEEGPVDENEGYFHAQFRQSSPLAYKQDHIIVDGIRGAGHYVGTAIGWQQNSNTWFGEGEFKAFIDGDDEFPTYCTTGTEDYFGGAWGFGGESFTAPFFGVHDFAHTKNPALPFVVVGNRFCLYRFHILDPIRFETDFKATIQALGWRSEHRYMPLQDNIASVAYWYQAEPHAPFPFLGTRDDLEVINGAHRDDMTFAFQQYADGHKDD